MADITEKFRRYCLEHARLYAPELLENPTSLVPVNPSQVAQAHSRSKEKAGESNRKKQAPKVQLKSPQMTQLETIVKEMVGTPPDLLLDSQPGISRLMSVIYQEAVKQSALESVANQSDSFAISQPSENPGATPRLEFTPSSLSRHMVVFRDRKFDLNAPDAKRVALGWSAREDRSSRLTSLDYKKKGLFEAIVGI